MPISLDSITTAHADNWPESLIIPSVPAGTNALYILQMYAYQGSVNTVTGLGLTWQSKGPVWYAEGTTVGGDVTIAFYFGGEILPPRAAIGAVLRYSGVGGFAVRTVETSDSLAEVFLPTLTPYTPNDMALIRVTINGSGVALTPQTGYTELLDTNVAAIGMALYSAPLSAPISGVMGYLSQDTDWVLYAINLIPADADNYYPSKIFDFSLGEESWIVPENGPDFSIIEDVNGNWVDPDEQIEDHCSWVDEPQCGVESGMWVARDYYTKSGSNYFCQLQIAFPGSVSFSKVIVHTGPTNGAQRDPITNLKHYVRVYDGDSVDGPWQESYGNTASSNTNDDCTSVSPILDLSNRAVAVRLTTKAILGYPPNPAHWASIVALEFVDFIDHDEILLITPPTPALIHVILHRGVGAFETEAYLPYDYANPQAIAVRDDTAYLASSYIFSSYPASYDFPVIRVSSPFISYDSFSSGLSGGPFDLRAIGVV